ncbi:hypothetical protein [Paraburkholderia dilworthii]|uniref:hypothetical protein n=1 Tax=Paraburkholderia dilworthii TaxID=948106 RepID=UPI0003F4F433|nr:hypothetical protein [Paraburkholderia dilworthii]
MLSVEELESEFVVFLNNHHLAATEWAPRQLSSSTAQSNLFPIRGGVDIPFLRMMQC